MLKSLIVTVNDLIVRVARFLEKFLAGNPVAITAEDIHAYFSGYVSAYLSGLVYDSYGFWMRYIVDPQRWGEFHQELLGIVNGCLVARTAAMCEFNAHEPTPSRYQVSRGYCPQRGFTLDILW